MRRPLIGITCHATPESLSRSAVMQLYIDAIHHAGGAPVLIPMGLDAESLRAIYAVTAGLLLPGGDDVAPERYRHEPHPQLGRVDANRDELEINVASWALADDMPLLGICRGVQVLAVAAGGTLWQDLPSQWDNGLAHDVREYGRDHLSHTMSMEPGSLLALALGTTVTWVNSFHHQAVWDLPPGFIVSARSEDGVVEAIESPDRSFCIGVQCHPEGMWDTTAPHFRGLFSAFVQASSRYSDHRDTNESAADLRAG